jgi:polyphosphate kinase
LSEDFLEHSRIYYFYNDGNDELYLSSADLMQRNLDRRVETTFPVEDESIKREIKTSILDTALMDNVKSRVLQPGGKFLFNRPVIGEEIVNHQEWLIENAIKKSLIAKKAVMRFLLKLSLLLKILIRLR